MMFYIVLLIFGLIFGSFASALVYRLPRGYSILGRSFCPLCKRKISWFDNIPVVSYLLLGGKCRKCRKKIPLSYPFIELGNASLFVAAGFLWKEGFSFLPAYPFSSTYSFLLLLLAFSFFFFLLSIIDFTYQIFPDSVLIVLLILAAFLLLALPSPGIFVHLLAGVLSFDFFLLLHLITRGRGLGFGDVKLAFVVGSILGFPGSLVWIMLSFVTGAVIGIFLIIVKRASFSKPIPFGPFLLGSAWLALFFSNLLWSWYFSLF